MIKVKVCGLNSLDNLINLKHVNIDFIGLNFYEKSTRCIDHNQAFTLRNYQDHKKVGVFVNASLQYVKDMSVIYKLDYVQLHGDESPDYVYELSERHKVIKVISVQNKEDLQLAVYYDGCEYLLFDTKCKNYGGSGQKFDWSIINYYNSNIPFFLAGGIAPPDISVIQKIDHPLFSGIDINSKFEKSPGIKDVNLVKDFVLQVKYNQ